MFSIYQIRRKDSGKSYVGWTSRTPEQRFVRHCYSARKGSKSYFHAAIRKYGIAAWDIRTLAICESAEEAKRLEKEFIAKIGSVEWGYNLTNGGDGLSDPTGKIACKISLTLKGRGLGIPKSRATRLRMSAAQKALCKNPEYKLRRSLIQKGKKLSVAHRIALSNSHVGIEYGPASELRKKRISESISKWWTKRRACS